MKYTVVIEQAVPEDVQPQLEQMLAVRFHLSPEQARKLASRRGGRLMKPTGRERAMVLLEIFQDINAKVRLEQVDEAAQDAAPGAGTLPGPSQGLPTVVPLQRSTELHATEFGQVVVPREASVALLETPEAVGGEVPALPQPEPMLPGNDDFWSELSAPASASAVSPLAPTSPLIPSRAAADAGLFLPELDAGSVPQSSFAQSSPASLSPNPLPLASSSDLAHSGTADSGSADIWSDFTGALTINDSSEAPKAAEEAPELVAQPETEAPLGRRQPLSRRLTIASVTPLAVYTVLTLTTLGLVLSAAQRSLISTNAATVAAAVGSVLNTTDQNTINQQLGTLLNRDSVGFVQVELPDGTIFFRSQTPSLDAVLGERVDAWVKAHPVSGVYIQKDTPAQLYNAQLQQLVSMGAQNSEPAAVLKRAIANPDNQSIANRSYQVERIGVYSGADGNRVTKAVNQGAASNLLYRIAVGVPIDGAQRQLRDTLLILLVAGLIAMLIAASLAARAARRIVEPIERLVKAADAISLGNLGQSVRPESNDEVGDLAQALERMRLSLDAAMERLRKRRSKA